MRQRARASYGWALCTLGLVAMAGSCSKPTETAPDAGTWAPDPNDDPHWQPPALSPPASERGPFVGDSARVPRSDPASAQQVAALLADRPVATPADLAARYPLRLYPALASRPSDAAGFDTIQHSNLALDDRELDALAHRSFVLSERQKYPSFGYGYQALYQADLPVYISADSILFAMHRSYDAILSDLETRALIPELRTLLTAMRGALSAGAGQTLGMEARADADLYLAVALSLLEGQGANPVAGADASSIAALTAAATAARGDNPTEIFGAPRTVDYSQFTPRGHYTRSQELTRYFRAMMWLGRIELRAIDVVEDHPIFRRRQLLASYVVRAAMDSVSRARWSRIDRVVEAFVGEGDDWNLPGLDGLLRDLGLADASGFASLSDEAIVAALRAGHYGEQRIASQILVGGENGTTNPLPVSFLLFGQRYILDSHVFSNVVYDRIALHRYMPDPLDAAFAALGNDHAGLMLTDQLTRFEYAPALHRMRVLADAHEDSFWEKNLYNRWLTALRTLSPREALATSGTAGLPRVALTEPWSRRLLNTQLASWAELRHDTLLYAKQSYTAGSTCSFPDAYVEPYPAFFGAIAAFADQGRQLVSELQLDASGYSSAAILTYFGKLATTARTLQHMAELERSGAPFGAAEMAFVNRIVSISSSHVCGASPTLTGWYADLFYDAEKALDFDPTIADVHTDPNASQVLHVATGHARTMVVIVESCTGPRAYAGLASSYFERTTENLDRFTDERWSDEIATSTPRDVRWVRDLVVR